MARTSSNPRISSQTNYGECEMHALRAPALAATPLSPRRTKQFSPGPNSPPPPARRAQKPAPQESTPTHPDARTPRFSVRERVQRPKGRIGRQILEELGEN